MTDQPPLPPHAQPQPVPQVFGVGQVDTPNGPMVVLQLFGPCGQWVVFFDADSAERLAEQLRSQAQQTRAGIVVAQHMPVAPPNGHGRP